MMNEYKNKYLKCYMIIVNMIGNKQLQENTK